jgi:hypothetical protein
MKTVLAALTLLFATGVSPLLGQGDDEASRATLVGLPGVYVLVENVDDDAQRDGLDTLQVRTDVEVKLRQAGIRVLSREEWLSTAGVPNLYVNIQTAKNQQNVYAFSVRIELSQGVTLVRQPSPRLLVTTWSTPGVIGTVGSKKLASLRDNVRDQTDQFINAYLAANPKH